MNQQNNTDDPAPKIPGYLIKKVLGQGGMACVYLAVQESLDRSIALKILDQAIATNDPTLQERFLKEGKIVARLNHPNIITIHDIGHHNAIYYMAMEYMEGETLSDYLKKDVSIQKKFDIVRQIADALNYAHNHGVIHRDVKPANILFKNDDTVILTDFGIAKIFDGNTCLTAVGLSIGTPDYMSPEQVMGKQVDNRSDLYSLGILLYEILTERKPYAGTDQLAIALQHLNDPIPSLPDALAIYQPIINRLLAKSPEDRFDNARQLINEIDIHSNEGTSVDSGTITAVRAGTVLPATAVTPHHQKKLKQPGLNILKVSAVITLLAVCSILIFTSDQWLRKENNIPMTQESVETQLSNAPDTQELIERLLSNASKQMDALQLLEPEGDNAYDSYQQVLEYQPGNSIALSGLSRVVEDLGVKAREIKNKGEFEESLSIIDRALEINPTDTTLLSLRKEVTSLLRSDSNENTIKELLVNADNQMAALRLTQPADDNAYDTYKKVLQLAPGDPRGLAGMERIADQYHQMARSRRARGSMKKSLDMVERGLMAVPDHSGLLAFHKLVNQSIALDTAGQQNVRTLLNKAEIQEAASRLIEPSGDNAYETYMQVLEADVDNQQAKQGLERISQYLLKAASTSRLAGDLGAATKLVDKGLVITPGRKELLALKRELSSEIEGEERQANRKLEIELLLSRAQGKMDAGQLVKPIEENALMLYKKVLALDPGNQQARKGVRNIASKYAVSAADKRSQDKPQEALLIVNEGLIYVPDDPALASLQNELRNTIDARKSDAETRKRKRSLIGTF